MLGYLNKSLFAVGACPGAIRILLLSVLALLVSCSNSKDSRLAAENAMDKLVEEQQANKATGQAKPPAAVTESLLNNNNLAATPAAKPTERFDVSVRNVSARDFFLGLVNGTGINVVVHPDVSGNVTLDLNKVTVDDVLRVTRDIYGYEYKRDRGIYTIYPNQLRTQMFQINYLDVQRVGVSDTSVMIGRAQSNNNSGNGNNSGGSGSGVDDTANLLSMGGDAEKKNSGSRLTPGSRVQTLNHTDFWYTLEKTIISIIGGDIDNRSVMISPLAGMVVVKALPHELNAVRDYLERSELSAKRQVILEAKILEVHLNEGFEAGVNWGAIGGQVLLGKNVSEFSPPSEIITASEGVGEIFASLIKVNDITKLLSLLQTQGDVQVLSSPRVSTVNNQKAVIRVGEDEYFITGISSDTTTGATAVTSTPNIELSPFFSGISLDVTPQISDTGEVILHIHPIVSNVTDQLKVFVVGDEEFSLPLALRGIRESDSIVKAANGQVIVLGGLMTERSNNQDGKRQVLGDIPLLNSLFRTKNKTSTKTELVILLRPIVVGDSTWDAQLKDSQESMQRMGDAYRQQ